MSQFFEKKHYKIVNKCVLRNYSKIHDTLLIHIDKKSDLSIPKQVFWHNILYPYFLMDIWVAKYVNSNIWNLVWWKYKKQPKCEIFEFFAPNDILSILGAKIQILFFLWISTAMKKISHKSLYHIVLVSIWWYHWLLCSNKVRFSN